MYILRTIPYVMLCYVMLCYVMLCEPTILDCHSLDNKTLVYCRLDRANKSEDTSLARSVLRDLRNLTCLKILNTLLPRSGVDRHIDIAKIF